MFVAQNLQLFENYSKVSILISVVTYSKTDQVVSLQRDIRTINESL